MCDGKLIKRCRAVDLSSEVHSSLEKTLKTCMWCAVTGAKLGILVGSSRNSMKPHWLVSDLGHIIELDEASRQTEKYEGP